MIFEKVDSETCSPFLYRSHVGKRASVDQKFPFLRPPSIPDHRPREIDGEHTHSRVNETDAFRPPVGNLDKSSRRKRKLRCLRALQSPKTLCDCKSRQ